MNSGIFTRKTICIVTGASRGLGRALTVTLAPQFTSSVAFILLARSKDGLMQTAQELKSIPGRDAEKAISVCVKPVDLSDSSMDFASLLSDCLNELGTSSSDYEQALIIHNVGSLGDISKHCTDFSDGKELSLYFDLNLTNVMALNAKFMQLFPKEKTHHRVVVNISSITAVLPIKTFSLYCTGKAARDMYFRVLAAEESDAETLVLNYAPGPLKTEMGDVAKSNSSDPEVRKMFHDLESDGKIFEPSESVERLIQILKELKFKSGDHVDVTDEI